MERLAHAGALATRRRWQRSCSDSLRRASSCRLPATAGQRSVSTKRRRGWGCRRSPLRRSSGSSNEGDSRRSCSVRTRAARRDCTWCWVSCGRWSSRTWWGTGMRSTASNPPERPWGSCSSALRWPVSLHSRLSRGVGIASPSRIRSPRRRTSGATAKRTLIHSGSGGLRSPASSRRPSDSRRIVPMVRRSTSWNGKGSSGHGMHGVFGARMPPRSGGVMQDDRAEPRLRRGQRNSGAAHRPAMNGSIRAGGVDRRRCTSRPDAARPRRREPPMKDDPSAVRPDSADRTSGHAVAESVQTGDDQRQPEDQEKDPRPEILRRPLSTHPRGPPCRPCGRPPPWSPSSVTGATANGSGGRGPMTASRMDSSVHAAA